MNIADLRREYSMETLSEKEVPASPFEQFRVWFGEALTAQIHEPNAMTLATVNALGQPSARIVLLKGFDDYGFVFYTNYESHKARDLRDNPLASILFWWPELERQVRISGSVEKVSAAESEEYFRSRPRGSQLGAWASPQSRPIPSRKVLEEKINALISAYDGEDVLPLPPHWGGYRLSPDVFEFWQGRESRLHDRVQYTQDGDDWRIERLAP